MGVPFRVRNSSNHKSVLDKPFVEFVRKKLVTENSPICAYIAGIPPDGIIFYYDCVLKIENNTSSFTCNSHQATSTQVSVSRPL